MILHDQYDEPVDTDALAALPPYEELTPEDIKVVLDAPWYEVHGLLLAILPEELSWNDSDEPLDSDTEILQIADPLKRGDRLNGWYHA